MTTESDESVLTGIPTMLTAMTEVESTERVQGSPEKIEQAIIRQVEYYFSDANLPIDPHMLGLTGGSANMPVNVSRISGFPVMRKYKPLSRIKQALRHSTTLEFADSKYIRRIVPLSVEPQVEPELIPGKNAPPQGVSGTGPAIHGEGQSSSLANSQGRRPVDPERPWITKGLLQPTGFEEYYTDAPITPADYTTEQELYHSDLKFETRIETAIQRYTSRRKFHNDTAHIFDMFLSYGGIDCTPSAFSGGLSQADMDEMDAAEISAARARHYVAQHVEHTDDWAVSFADVARGFLSCSRVLDSSSGSPAAVKHFANVLANFYRYLLYHNVCPEYTDQIREAMRICHLATTELVVATQLSGELTERFNRSCSALSGGLFAGLIGDSSSWGGDVDLGITKDTAQRDYASAVEQLGSMAQREAARAGVSTGVDKTLECDLALQVVSIQLPVDQSAQDDEQQMQTRFGKLLCRRMDKYLVALQANDEKEVEFWIERDVLGKCFVGMKLVVVAAENSMGCTWIDRIISVEASYHQKVTNDYWSKGANLESGLPKEWYKRQKTIYTQGYDTGRADEEAEPALNGNDFDDVDETDDANGLGNDQDGSAEGQVDGLAAQ